MICLNISKGFSKNMNLVERLNRQIQLLESKGEWGFINNSGKSIEYVKNPSSNELYNFAKDTGGLRGVKIKNDWYFWNSLSLIHESFVKALNKMHQWNQYIDKVELDRQARLTLESIHDFIYWQHDDFLDAINKNNFQSNEFEKSIKEFTNICKELENKFSMSYAPKVKTYIEEMLKGIHLNPDNI